MLDLSSDAVVFSGQVTGVSGFSALEHLGLSKVSDSYEPSARGYGWVDNIRVFTQVLAGDMNCDGEVNFGDINPFVKYVGNCAAWQTAFPGCPVEHGDIDGDGLHVCNGFPFDDINAFVALLSGRR